METRHQPQDIVANQYRIVSALGQGGMGTTYEAEDLTNYQRVAIKAVSLRNIQDWKILELFEREAKVLSTLNHPAIPKYLDYFHIDTPFDRRFYLVQELVSGKSLADLVRQGWHANEGEIKQIAIQVLAILKYLHQLNPPVIHRDIKPQNIILRQDGKVFLVDFGAVQNVYRNTVGFGSTFVGTLGYMPLEQLRGKVFFASDLYSLGATLLFLLTHRSPDELPQSRMKIDFQSRIIISNKLANWLEKMLEPAIEDRFQSANEALQALRGKPINSASPDLTPKKPAHSRVSLKKTDMLLVIDIPMYPVRCRIWRNLLHAVILNVLLITLNLLLITAIGLMISFLFLIIFDVLFALYFVLSPLFISSDRLYIEVDLKQQTFLFALPSRNFPLSKHLPTKLKNAEQSSNGLKVKEALWKAMEQAQYCLTAQELKWLDAELSDWLSRIADE